MKEISRTTVRSEVMEIDYGKVIGIRQLDRNLYWQVIECPACRKPVLREGWYREEIDDEEGPNYEVIFPSYKEKK
jgi:hypothetical protein